MSTTTIFFAVLGILSPIALGLYLRHINAKREDERESTRIKAVDQKELLGRITELERVNGEVRAQLAQAQPFYAAMQAKMVEIMTHPSKEFKKADALLKKVVDGTITAEEQVRLDNVLIERAVSKSDEVTDEERLIAVIFPTIQVLAEAEKLNPAPVTSLMVIAAPASTENPKEGKD